jgi:pSer/pThr/pTyr-binding forkhead associated (FHA) protein
VDILAFPPECEIIFGRDRECHVRYSETDELVSRKHLKIAAAGEKPVRYLVTDLGSRNGTFVNRQRVFGAVHLQPGARVQLGVGGPEFEFRLEQPSGHDPSAKATSDPKPKARLVRRTLAILLPLAAGFGAYLAWANIRPLWQTWRGAQSAAAAAPKFNPATALAAIATVEAQWSLSERQTGRRLDRLYVRNERISGTGNLPFIEGAPALLPAFILLDDRTIEPLLVAEGGVPGGRPIAGKWTARGVIVSDTATALAPAPLRKPWTSTWAWSALEPAGALFVLESGKVSQVAPLAAAQFPQWIPAESGWLVEQFQEELHREVRGRRVSSEDLQIQVAITVGAAGRRWKASVEESSGLLMASPEPGALPENLAAPPLDDGTAAPGRGQTIWIAGDRVDAGTIENVGEDGAVHLSAPLCRDGGVVFDDQARALALCVPTRDAALPVRRALDLFQGAVHGQSW